NRPEWQLITGSTRIARVWRAFVRLQPRVGGARIGIEHQRELLRDGLSNVDGVAVERLGLVGLEINDYRFAHLDPAGQQGEVLLEHARDRLQRYHASLNDLGTKTAP